MSHPSTPKKPVPQDWHRADIKAALEKAGYTLRRLAIQHDLAPGYFRSPLNQPHPRAQALLAKAIGVQPQAIWPSRYEPNGMPKRGLYTNTAKGIPYKYGPRKNLAPFTSVEGSSRKSNAKVPAVV